MTARSRTRSRSRTAVAALSLLVGLAACTGADDGADPAPTDPTGTEDAATAGPVVPLADPTVGLSATGWLDAAGPFADLALGDTPVEDWPDLLVAVNDAAGAAGPAPFTVTTEVARDPDVCTLWRVGVTDVAFDGATDPGAQAMRGEVLAVLAGIDHDAGPLLAPGETPWCEGLERASLAWYATVVTPTFCALPDDDALACLTVTTMRYDGGAHPNVVATDLVLDRTTGQRHDAASLLALRGLDVAATTALVEAAVCDLDRAAGAVGADQDCWPITLRNVRPTPAGLVLSFSPYESGPYAAGARDLFVPWAELEAAPAAPAAAVVTAEVAAAQRVVRDALASGDWDAVTALVPADGEFLVATGERTADPVGVLRGLLRDPRPELLAALAQAPGVLDGTTVWPGLAVRDPFTLDAAERPALTAAFGPDAVAAWDRAGRYTGWRLGFDADGTWRFAVAGE